MIDDGDDRAILSEHGDPQAAARAVGRAAERGRRRRQHHGHRDRREGGGTNGADAAAAAPEREDTPSHVSRRPKAPEPPPPPPERSAGDDDAPEIARRPEGRDRVVSPCRLRRWLRAARYLLDNSWFVGANEDGNVTIYQGIPEEIAGLDLKDEQEVTDVQVDDLPEFLQGNVEEGIKVSISRRGARANGRQPRGSGSE